jgi:hypothetical protein
MPVTVNEDRFGCRGACGDEGVHERQTRGRTETELEGADRHCSIHRYHPRGQGGIRKRSLSGLSCIGAETEDSARKLGKREARDIDLRGIVDEYLLDLVGPDLGAIMRKEGGRVEEIRSHAFSALFFPLGRKLGDRIAFGSKDPPLPEKAPGTLGPVGDYADDDLVGFFALAPIQLPSRTDSQTPCQRLRDGYHIFRSYCGFHDFTIIMD